MTPLSIAIIIPFGRNILLASRSASSFSGCPECPFTHSNVTRRPASAASSSFMISTLSTGFPSPLRQPLRFQPGIHLVSELITYIESQ